jgi:hypothetical protein
MGFIICKIEPLENESRIRLRRTSRIALGGTKGCLARHLPNIERNEDGKWTLNAEELMRLEEPNAGPDTAIYFEHAPNASAKLAVLKLIKVSGRIASLVTDVLFHFKTIGAGERDGEGCLVVPLSKQQPETYEQMRLDGGHRGGTWAWSEPPQALGASVLAPAGKKATQP